MHKPETHNGMTFEMAQTKVNGTKYRAINKFKQFVTPDFGYDDMVSEADMAILKAWREWDPSKTLFNTHATNMITWMMYRALENHNPVFRMNRKTKMNLNNRGESFKTLYVKKVTADAEFNCEHDLDGEKEFTRDLFNAYVYYVSSKTFGVSVKNQSEFNNPNCDVYNIMDTVVDESATEAMNRVEFDTDLDKMDESFKKVYQMVADGYTIKDALKEAGTSRARLRTLYKKTQAKEFVLA